MNERERFVRTLICAHPDRPSYGDYLAFDSTRERWEKEGLPKGLSRQQRCLSCSRKLFLWRWN